MSLKKFLNLSFILFNAVLNIKQISSHHYKIQKKNKQLLKKRKDCDLSNEKNDSEDISHQILKMIKTGNSKIFVIKKIRRKSKKACYLSYAL